MTNAPASRRRQAVVHVTTTTQKLLLLLALGLVLAPFAFPSAAADPVSVTGLVPGASSRRDLSSLNTTQVDAQAGNVTQLDIDALSITQSWQGYYGNVSGSMLLANANNQTFYDWANGTSVGGQVYASRNDTVDWSTINCSNASVIAAEEAYLGQNAGDADSVNNTFSGTAPSFLVGSRTMSGCPGTNVFVNGSAQSTDYHQILLADGAGKTVYTTIIDHGAYGFDGEQHDFQLLVGENGHVGDTATTPYFFYTELG